ncbi:hypothetical protein Tco_1372768 [Tanacetum coccineum]
MSDYEDSMVTYTAVSSPFGGLSNIGSLGVDRPHVIPEDPYAYVVGAFHAPPSPDYVPSPKYPPLPDFVQEPVYLKFMPPEDESSNDDEDDDVDIKGDEEEEEEHPAPADSTAVALPATDHAPSTEETKPFETDDSAATPPPHLAYRVIARISIRDEPPTPFWSDTKVARVFAIPTPPPSPLSPWSSPLPQIPSPPLPPILSPLPVSSPPPTSPTYPLGYRAAMIQLRAEALSTSHSPPPHIILSHTKVDTPPLGTPPSGTPPLLPIPLPASSPTLLLPYVDHRVDRPEVCLPPRKRLCFVFGLRYEAKESSSAAAARHPGGFRVDYGFVSTIDREIRRDLERDVGYGIIDTWDEMLVDIPGAPTTDDTELGRRMIEFSTRVRQDTDEVMSLRTTVLGQQAVITELQAANRKRQASITELLAADRRRHAQFIEALKLLKRLQTQMTEF